jgi:hypothetical protein
MGSPCLLDHIGSNLITFRASYLELGLTQAGDHGVRPPLSRLCCRIEEEAATAVRSRADGHNLIGVYPFTRLNPGRESGHQ